ncbi:CHASE4 domain-containing protein, partial [Pseudomonas viridiflava]|uniref:CHASE4 domain-containing protein n=1 Tax=Pseudomonas viridiflava TaxID=33069 RepID=UPI003C72C8B8
PPQPVAPLNRTSVALTRISLFKFIGLLVSVFLLAGYLLVYLARDMDRTEETEGAFYTEKAVHSFEKSLRSVVKDYALWGDAYKHLHVAVDTDWAYVRQNIGPSLYDDFGFQALFVVDDTDRTVYA